MPRPPLGFDWDERKAALNLRKHGVSFALAPSFQFETALELESRDHGQEERYIAIGRIGRALHTLVYIIRQDKIRIVSLRKATAEERRACREGRG